MAEKIERKTETVGRPHFSASATFGLGTLLLASLCFVVLLAALVGSVGLNLYLGWELSGLEISLVTRGPATATTVVNAVAPPTQVVVVIPVVDTPVPVSSTHTPTAMVSIDETAVDNTTPSAAYVRTVEPVVVALTSTPAPTSTNTYTLIPLEGRRDQSRPADENPDLNLKLREPQLSKAALTLVDISESPKDSDAPKLGAVFEPDFVATYAVHDWDWDCNCQGPLIEDERSVLVGIKTMPGQPIYIPHRRQDIYGGQYYAVVLYASEDSLTFMYHRGGSIASGYAVHYEGLQTDPNLLALYKASKGGEAPGLTLTTPVGTAAGDELIVSMRDNGMFLDTRSRKDWWE